MLKLIKITILLFFIGCGSEQDYQEVMINKSVKVFSKNYHDKAENYTFKWEPPMDPNNKPIPFDLKNDMLIFSPSIEGNYQIHLSITDISDEVVSEEMFYYKAIPETLSVAIIEPTYKKHISEHSSVVKTPKPKSHPNNKITNVKKSHQETRRGRA